MKQIMIFACCMLLSSAARAQERTVQETVEAVISHAEETTRCIAAAKECPEAEALALKAAAVTDMYDIALLCRPGLAGRIGLTNETIMALAGRLDALQGQLAHIKLLDTVCNFGILVLNSGAGIIYECEIYSPFIPFFIVLIGILIGLLMMSAGGLIMLSCLFWWL